jgi:GTP cyclohydrolase I
MTDCKKCNEHQAPSGTYDFNDYSDKMPDLVFRYDQDHYPNDDLLPDPQVDPYIPGKRVPLKKVGIAPVDLPIVVKRRDGGEQVLQAQASLYCSLDDPHAKGLNLSRLYLIMDETIKDHLSIDGITNALAVMSDKLGSENAYCKLRFRYPWNQKALRSRQPLTPEEEAAGEYMIAPNGEKISLRKMVGHIAYNVTIEGRHMNGVTKFYLTTEYSYSSTCPCSFELAHDATTMRDAAANAHSQRSVMTTTVEFDPSNIIWIEDMIELHRQLIPTEVQVVVKRRDEQAFAELNGSNLLFSEDAVRIVYLGLEEWVDGGRITDFSIATSHQESLHPWDAIAVTWYDKDVQNG